MGQSVRLNMLIALVAAGLFVTTESSISTLVVIAWFGIVTWIAARSSGPRANRIRNLLVQFIAFSVVTLVAHLAPLKTHQDHFSKPVRLPNADLTVAEIERIAITVPPDEFPVCLSLDCDDDTRTKTVRFPSKEMSLGDFIATVEKQTALRHHFLHCGNAYTILWGYPPSYFLTLRADQHGSEFAQ